MVAVLYAPRNEGWTKAMNRIIRDGSIRPVHRLLYVIVQSYTRETWRWCTEPHRVLAADYGCSESQIQRLLNDMVDRDLLLARPRGHGQAKAYLPIIGLTPAEIAAAGPPPPTRTAPLSNPAKMLGYQTEDPEPNPAFPSALPSKNAGANPAFLRPFKEDRLTPEKTGSPEISGSLPGPAANAAGAPARIPGPGANKPDPAPKPQPPASSPTGSSAPSRATPQSRLVDLLRAGGVEIDPSPRDFAALKQRQVDPALVVECYLAIRAGRYGDAWMKRRLTVHGVVNDYLDGYLADRQAADGSGRPSTDDINRGRTGLPGSRNGRIDPAALEEARRSKRW
jgi:hypothetical protein